MTRHARTLRPTVAAWTGDTLKSPGAVKREEVNISVQDMHGGIVDPDLGEGGDTKSGYEEGQGGGGKE